MSKAVIFLALLSTTLALSPQKGMLDVLGLQRAPKIPKEWRSGSAPNFLLDRFQPNGPLDADISISFPDKARVPGWLWFDLSDVGKNDVLLYAEVRIYVTTQAQLTLIDSTGTEVASTYAKPGWVAMDVSLATERWLKKPHANLGLAVEIRSPTGVYLDPPDVGPFKDDDPKELKPFMVAYFGTLNPEEVRKHCRQTRSVQRPTKDIYKVMEDMKLNFRMRNDSKKNSAKEHKKFYNHEREKKPYKKIYSNQTCSHYPFYVNFKDLNWHEWIIAPAGFEAGLCYGPCHAPPPKANNHALVQSMMEVFGPAHWPKSCCVPTRLSDLNVLYFDDKMNVVMKTLKNMVVSECGCR